MQPTDVIFGVLSELDAQRIPAPSKTKLLKLLYLIDLESVRTRGEALTGWSWTFLHFGPWTSQYDDALNDLARRDAIQLKQYGDNELTTLVIPQNPDRDLSRLGDGGVQNVAARVLNRWGWADLREILDFVYFETEPMRAAERNQRLDFDLVPRGRYPVYRRAVSDADSKTLARMRERISPRRPMKVAEAGASYGGATPPRYDDEYLRALDALEDD